MRTASKNGSNDKPGSCSVWTTLIVGLLCALGSGCGALHPVRGVPAAYLPHAFEGPSRDNKRTIDPSLLVRTSPDQHRVAAGDVLSIYIPRVLGAQSTEMNSVGIEPPINIPPTAYDPPTIGYPISVRDDHTISLPQIPPLSVFNLTLQEVEDLIRRTYTLDHQILQPHEALVMVSLQRPRVHRVLVVRQEANSGLSVGSGPGQLNIGTTGKGVAREVVLRAYENDVLHALSRAEGGADGLPGLNAKNTIYVIRRRSRPACGPLPGMPHAIPITPPHPGLPVHPFPAPLGRQAEPQSGVRTVQHEQLAPFGSYRQHAGAAALDQGHSASGWAGGGIPPESAMNMDGHAFLASPPLGPTPLAPPPIDPGPAPGDPYVWGAAMLADFDPTIENPNVIKIPVRLGPGEAPHITEEQITLYDGDIVFIESRETEVFYTGGLLGGGQYTLPRDYDLRVLEAVSIAEGSGQANNQMNSLGGVSALNKDVSNSASRLAILRTLPTGQRITIEVDLHKAMKYREENIIVQPGDMLILEYTAAEAMCAFTHRFLLEGALIGIATSMFTTGGGR